jgi:hypothetical protein
MKRSQKFAVGVLASVSLSLASLSAHAQPGAAGGTGPGMMGGTGHHQGKGAAGHQGRMGQGHPGAQTHGQHGATASGPMAVNCPMAAQHTEQNTHSH